jgi:D-hydroxyproline dehydrogenase subunit beta
LTTRRIKVQARGVRSPAKVDVAIVGAGIVGLAHAVEAVRRGLSVVVVERDDRATGASVRNFGHGCFTVQADDALHYALVARERWLELAELAGFWVSDAGTVVVARAEDELAVLDEFAALRNGQVELLEPDEVAARATLDSPDILGGAWLPLDLRVDARAALPALAAWLQAQGVEFRWATAAVGAETSRLATSRGDIEAELVVVASGHDLDRLFPEVAEVAGLERCSLHMLRVASPGDRRIDPAVLTGLSLLRYRGFAECPSLAAVHDRFARDHPQLLDADVNLMLTQRPDGDLTIGDTHAYARTPSPFRDEQLDELLLAQTAALLGVDHLAVHERWRGIYAHAPGREFLVASPAPGVRAVAVTSGIGMTTALGLAPAVLDDVLVSTT